MRAPVGIKTFGSNLTYTNHSDVWHRKNKLQRPRVYRRNCISLCTCFEPFVEPKKNTKVLQDLFLSEHKLQILQGLPQISQISADLMEYHEKNLQ
ncbi:MAG TPA: hypothetical protein DCQ58_00050 [Saprospirales bacterium]|nr:hypothetical protein [Saprospirales bacterium]